jgi:DnaJ-class molecular chaperone
MSNTNLISCDVCHETGRFTDPGFMQAVCWKCHGSKTMRVKVEDEFEIFPRAESAEVEKIPKKPKREYRRREKISDYANATV